MKTISDLRQAMDAGSIDTISITRTTSSTYPVGDGHWVAGTRRHGFGFVQGRPYETMEDAIESAIQRAEGFNKEEEKRRHQADDSDDLLASLLG